MTEKKNALVPITDTILALKGDTAALAAAVQENLGGEQISVFDLERVKIPAGGGPSFTVITPDGEEDSLKTITGSIILVEKRKAWWKSRGVDGSPPTCRSTNYTSGMGPWGEGGKPALRNCELCEYNQFETAVKDDGSLGKGKACKDMRLLFFLREGAESMLPSLVILPPTSIKPMQRYSLALAAKGIGLTAALTTLTLQKAANSEGTPYSECRPTMERRLNDVEKAALKIYAEGIRPLFQSIDTTPIEAAVQEIEFEIKG